jgi:hypothetical protein
VKHVFGEPDGIHLSRVRVCDGLVPVGALGEACRQHHPVGHHGRDHLLGRTLPAALHRHSCSVPRAFQLNSDLLIPNSTLNIVSVDKAIFNAD